MTELYDKWNFRVGGEKKEDVQAKLMAENVQLNIDDVWLNFKRSY